MKEHTQTFLNKHFYVKLSHFSRNFWFWMVATTITWRPCQTTPMAWSLAAPAGRKESTFMSLIGPQYRSQRACGHYHGAPSASITFFKTTQLVVIVTNTNCCSSFAIASSHNHKRNLWMQGYFYSLSSSARLYMSSLFRNHTASM